jgi:ATP-dependent RNA helicase RhlE
MPFSHFNLHPDLNKGVRAMGFVAPRPVQAKAIPLLMEGKDVLASAETGSGKTAAFLLPIMHRLIHENATDLRALILEPTRELAAQVETQARDIGRFTNIRCAAVFGGTGFHQQKEAVRKGAQIVVATPGRLLDHLENRSFHLDRVHTLVLDEADRMLDMGFIPQIRRILHQLPPKRQTLLFSATMPYEIESLSHVALVDPVQVDLSEKRMPPSTISQVLYPVSRSQKDDLFIHLLKQVPMRSLLVFTRTKRGADWLQAYLKAHNFQSVTLHSDRSQAMREQALKEFSEGKYPIMVATDIASRGLDIKGISHVINYDIPHSPEDYVHRIGRTGRAEASGDAYTIVTHEDEREVIAIEKYIGRVLPRAVLPDFPYKIPPRTTSISSSAATGFRMPRRRIASSRSALFRRR